MGRQWDGGGKSVGLFRGCGVVPERIRLHSDILGISKSYVLKKKILFDNAKVIMPFGIRNLYYVIDGSEELIDINRSYKYYITLLYAFSSNKLFVFYIRDGEILYDIYDLVENGNIYEFYDTDIIANCNLMSLIDTNLFDNLNNKDCIVYAIYCQDNPIGLSRIIVAMANKNKVAIFKYEEVI